MSVFKYYLNDTEYTPINTGDFTLDKQLVTESGAYHYIQELNGTVDYDGAAYQYIMNHGECQKIVFKIVEFCGNDSFTIYEGFFTIRNVENDSDKKIAKCTITEDSLYECLTRNYDRKFNFLEVGNIVSTTYEDTSKFEFLVYSPANTSFPPDYPFYGAYIQIQPFGSPYLLFAVHCREVRTTYCQGGEPQAPSGTGWQVLIDSCNSKGTTTWWRRPPVFDAPFLLLANFTQTTCIPPCTPPTPPVTAANEDWLLMDTVTTGGSTFGFWIDYNAIKGTEYNLNNGRLLTEVIDYGLNKVGCSELDLQSLFLRDSVNPVTLNSPSSTQGIQLHALSDIKDPNATEPATREDVTIKELLEGYISGKLNCFWYIDEGTKRLIIEHYNDLFNQGSLDITKYQVNKNKYSYDNSDLPKAEEFPSLDSSIDFTGVDIIFDNNCSKDVKAYPTDKFYSEIEAIVNNPDEYGNDGIVVITPDSSQPLSTRAEIGAITGDYRPNMPQAMANLQDKFWKYYRPFDNGEMNFQDDVFTKSRPDKVLEDIVISNCCWFSFNPRYRFIGNNFSNGQLQTASLNFKTKQITLSIKYKD